MDKSIILLLVFSLILSGISFYLGYWRPSVNFSGFAKVSFIFCTFFLTPALAVVLFLQSTAKDRLSETGFVPYPQIKETVGIAFGTGENPTWIFKIKGENYIESFYSYESNRPGWKLIKSSENMQTYQKGSRIMSIGHQKGWTSSSIIYMLEND